VESSQRAESSKKASGKSRKAAEGLKKAVEELENKGISRRDWAALPTLAEMSAGVAEVEKEFPEASPWAVAFFIGRELVQQGRERAEREERAVGAIERVAAAAEDMSATAKVIHRYQGRMENELSELVGYVYADKTWARRRRSRNRGTVKRRATRGSRRKRSRGCLTTSTSTAEERRGGSGEWKWTSDGISKCKLNTFFFL
jgi:hypothetical protein